MRKKRIGVQEISRALPRPATAATKGDWGQSPLPVRIRNPRVRRGRRERSARIL